jgi:hypothetical protein
MKQLLDANILITDPDSLQFCLPVSEYRFWYCEPNGYNDLALPESDSTESRIFDKYAGYPWELLQDAQKEPAVKRLIQNRQLWLCGEIDVRDFPEEERMQLLADYSYRWEDFSNEAERNQIIAEIYFENYPMDFRYDNKQLKKQKYGRNRTYSNLNHALERVP